MNEFEVPPIKVQVGPAEEAAGVVYVHDVELEPEHELEVGQRVTVMDEAYVVEALVEERVGPRWRLRLLHTTSDELERLRAEVDADPERRARVDRLNDELRRQATGTETTMSDDDPTLPGFLAEVASDESWRTVERRRAAGSLAESREIAREYRSQRAERAAGELRGDDE